MPTSRKSTTTRSTSRPDSRSLTGSGGSAAKSALPPDPNVWHCVFRSGRWPSVQALAAGAVLWFRGRGWRPDGEAGLLRTSRPGEAAPRRRRSRRPIASWPCSITRTAIRAITRPKQKFKEISEAYDVLKDDQKRAAYDRFGHAAFENGGAVPADAAAGSTSTSAAAASPTSSTRCSATSWAAAAAAAVQAGRGADLRYNLEISLEEAFAGSRRRSACRPPCVCEGCSGTRRRAGTQPITCPTCRRQARCAPSRASSRSSGPARPATAPAGSSRTPARSAAAPAGRARKRPSQVNIPPASRTAPASGWPARARPGLRGAPPGDLYIFLAIAPHRFFQRDGANIHCRVPIPMTTGGARRRGRGAEHRRQPRQGHRAGRHPVRPPVPPEGQGHVRAARDASAATCMSRPWSRRRST